MYIVKKRQEKLYGDASAGLITERNTAKTHRQLKNQYSVKIICYCTLEFNTAKRIISLIISLSIYFM